MKSISYKEAGVDISKGNEAVNSIKQKVKSTYNQNVLTELGGFGGMYAADFAGYKNPVLVSSVDGVGTKLKIAFMLDRHSTVGQDLVNHCVNDIAVGGAKPLFFLDYFACGKLENSIFDQVLDGFIRACKHNQCALIGGETAEMPDLYSDGEYDLAGTIVGVVEKDKIINGHKIEGKELLIGVNSNGLHTNGFSLARKVLFSKYKITEKIEELGSTLGEELLKIHLSYLDLISAATKGAEIDGIAHITGGGIEANTQRLISPERFQLKIDWQAWDIPPIFKLIQKTGNVSMDDMRSAFNLGIGLVFIVNRSQETKLKNIINLNGFTAYNLGEVVKI